MAKQILLIWVILLSGMFCLKAENNHEKITGFHPEKLGFFFPPPASDTTIFDTVSIATGVIITHCLDTTVLTGPVDTIYNACANNYSPAVRFTISANSNCIKYDGITCGTDTACIVICDINGVCDTTTFIISALDPDCFPTKSIFYDTIFVFTSDSVDIDLNDLNGTPIGIENACESSSGTSIVFSIDSLRYRIQYNAFDVGTDTACIVTRDDRGFTDTTCIIITGKVPQVEMICDTLELGTDTLYCLINDELEGQIVSVTNVCPDLSGDTVNFVIDDVNLCVEVYTLELGTDTACVVICDEFDVCDTFIFKITVIMRDDTTGVDTLIAVNDTTTTQQNTPLVINVLGNDTVPGGPVLVEIVTDPANGIVIVNPDFTIGYSPNANFCGLDSFQYRVCNQTMCDTAWVFIDVECEQDSFIIYNGISPNGDGDNETFFIKGIEKFPNNKVWVYNRWGNQVFYAEGYRSTWDGTWNGKVLPDGTYFYLIDLGDNSDRLAGFLQINR